MRTKPGEVHDKKGVPIYPGDLLKSFHFQGRRWRKMYYLYHTAVWNEQHQTMEMIPTTHLEPTLANRGGRCWLTPELAAEAEIIHGPDDLDYTDRKKWGNN